MVQALGRAHSRKELRSRSTCREAPPADRGGRGGPPYAAAPRLFDAARALSLGSKISQLRPVERGRGWPGSPARPCRAPGGGMMTTHLTRDAHCACERFGAMPRSAVNGRAQVPAPAPSAFGRDRRAAETERRPRLSRDLRFDFPSGRGAGNRPVGVLPDPSLSLMSAAAARRGCRRPKRRRRDNRALREERAPASGSSASALAELGKKRRRAAPCNRHRMLSKRW